MKRIIRKSTFESNSSSSHSLVVTKNGGYFTHEEMLESMCWIDNDGNVSYFNYELEFERTPNAPLYTFEEKLRYLIASYGRTEDKLEELLNTVKEIIPEVKGFKFPKGYRSDKPYYGYIDGQSHGIISSYLEKNNISFKEFLTNRRYIIIIDGDEYEMWDTFKKCGLIDTNNIEEEFDGGCYEENY